MTQTDERNGVHQSKLLAGLALSQLLVALDFSIIYVALPSIGTALSFSAVTLQWVVSAYAVFFAGFLLLGGRLVDVFGPGRTFVAAQVIFVGAAVLAGFAPTAGVLVIARATQGIGAALLAPATLGLLHANYPSGRARDRALAVWGTAGALGLALGVLLGGLLLGVASWPWIFWINFPVAVVSIAAVGTGALRTGAPKPGRQIDLPSAALATVMVGGVSLAFTELALPTPQVWVVGAAFGGSLLAGAMFVSLQIRRQDPLITVELFRSASLPVGCVIAALYMASMGAEFYLVTLFLQQELGLPPFLAGVGFLPLALLIALGNALAGRLVGRWGVRVLLCMAFGIGAVGLGLLAFGTGIDGYWMSMLPGLVVSGLGQGMAFTGMFIAGTRDLPSGAEGTGSAMITASQYTGGAIGLALLVWLHGSEPSASTLAVTFLATVLIALLALPVAMLLPQSRDELVEAR